MSSSQMSIYRVCGNVGASRQLDLAVLFMLFSWEFAYFGVPYELRRGYSYGLGEVVERATAK